MITTVREKGLRMEVPMDASHADSRRWSPFFPPPSPPHLFRFTISSPPLRDTDFPRRLVPIDVPRPLIHALHGFRRGIVSRLLAATRRRYASSSSSSYVIFERGWKNAQIRARERITIARGEHLGREEKFNNREKGECWMFGKGSWENRCILRVFRYGDRSD